MIDALGLGGGAEHSMASALPLLRVHHVDSVVRCIHPREGGLQAELVSQGFDVQVLPGRSWLARARALRREVRRLSPDVVHATLLHSCLLARLSLVGTGVARVDSLVNTSYDPVRREVLGIPAWKLQVFKMLDGITARHLGGHFHAITETVRAEAIDVLGIPSERVTVIGRGRSGTLLGSRTPERRHEVRSALGLAPDAAVVVAVGRQDAQKAHDLLIRAFDRVVRDHPDAHLLVAGRPGDATDKLNAALRKSSSRAQVHLLGHRSDVPDLFAAADVFAFPSLYEGLGCSLIEAMALATPIVGSDAPAIAEVLGHGRYGTVVPRHDEAALAEAISALLDDAPRREAMGERARQRFLERYELDQVVEATADLYRKVAADGGGPTTHPAQRLLGSEAALRIGRRLHRDDLTVLAYHQVDDASAFATQMDLLVDRCNPVAAAQVADAVYRRAELPPNPVLVTFDDGHETIATTAAEILRVRNVPAVAFVVAGLIDSEEPYWWDVAKAGAFLGVDFDGVRLTDPAAVTRALKATPDELRRSEVSRLVQELVALDQPVPGSHLSGQQLLDLPAMGIDIGHHSLTHPCLDHCDDETVVEEMAGAHGVLRGLLGHTPRWFAYPNGNHDPRVEDWLEDHGYELGFLFDHRINRLPVSNPLRISRVRVDASADASTFGAMLSGAHPAVHRLRGRS
ncbi:glycosyltransferase [Salinilacustrithrix flava]|uniref:glycosyltransferase n=2 Tax=Salinilacustrithrix flava TaxID=2957203 RepID=UPI003D7C15AC